MMTRRSGIQSRFVLVDWDELIPEDHLLRYIDRLIDFSFIYDKVEHLYSRYGRPSIDPVLLFKMLLIGYLYGIPYERQLVREVHLNLAYRWFLGLEIDDPVPHHSVFSKNRQRRFGDGKIFQQIFDHLVMQCVEKGLVTGELVVTDSTHIKANAALGKNAITVEVTKTPSQYLQQLDAEAERLEDELDQKKPPKGGARRSRKPNGRQTSPKAKKVKISKTDPDARLLGRPGKPGGLHFLAHQTIDAASGIIIDSHVTPGNVNDHEPYGQRLKRIQNTLGIRIKQAAADRGYDTMSTHHKLHDLGVKGFIPQHVKRGPAKTFRKDRFKYVADEDYYLCPAGKRLTLNHISHAIKHKVYASNAATCNGCSLKSQCVPKTATVKQITRPFFQDYADVTHSRIGTAAYNAAQRARRIWCEGTFAVQKRHHNLSRAMGRGIKRMQEQALMSATVVNIKRMVKAMQRMEAQMA